MFLLPFTPIAAYIAVYVGAAVLPAIILMRYIYNQDSIEKEPGYLLKKLFVGGIWAALASILLETIGTTLLNAWIPDADSPAYKIVLAFLVVAVAEEGTKYFFLRRRSWNDPNFDFRFDGIVYAVFVSLGFAAFENISYVFSYGLGVSIPRAFLSIPGHMGFAVVMGVSNVFGAVVGSAVVGAFGAERWPFMFYLSIPFCIVLVIAAVRNQ